MKKQAHFAKPLSHSDVHVRRAALFTLFNEISDTEVALVVPCLLKVLSSELDTRNTVLCLQLLEKLSSSKQTSFSADTVVPALLCHATSTCGEIRQQAFQSLLHMSSLLNPASRELVRAAAISASTDADTTVLLRALKLTAETSCEDVCDETSSLMVIFACDFDNCCCCCCCC